MQGSVQLDRNWIFNLNDLRIVIGYFTKRFLENPPGIGQNCRTIWILFEMAMSSWSPNWLFFAPFLMSIKKDGARQCANRRF